MRDDQDDQDDQDDERGAAWWVRLGWWLADAAAAAVVSEGLARLLEVWPG